MILDILHAVEVHWNKLGVCTRSLSLISDRDENGSKGTVSNILLVCGNYSRLQSLVEPSIEKLVKYV
jgi:hypothetical protein